MAGLIVNYIAKGSGTPSAAPSIPTGENAFYLDETNALLYVYDTTTAAWLKVGPYTLSAGTTGAIGAVRIDKAPSSGDPIAITAAGMTPAVATGAPSSGAYLAGELYVDSAYALYVCSAGGTPGTWHQVSGGGSGSGLPAGGLAAQVVMMGAAGTDYALAPAGTPSADVSLSGGGWALANVNDGNDATGWAATDGNANHWVEIDLGSAEVVAIVRVRQAATHECQYTLSASNDNSTWTQIGGTHSTATDQTFSTGTTTAYRYWRITNTTGNGNWFAVDSFELRAPGTASWAYPSVAVTVQNTSYTVTDADGTIYVGAASLTITLPTASSRAGRRFTIKNTNAGSSTTVNTGGGTIENGSSYSLSAALGSIVVESDGTNWWIVAKV